MEFIQQQKQTFGTDENNEQCSTLSGITIYNSSSIAGGVSTPQLKIGHFSLWIGGREAKLKSITAILQKDKKKAH